MPVGEGKRHIVLLFTDSIFFPGSSVFPSLSLGTIITITNPQDIFKQMADSKSIPTFTTQSLLPKLFGTGLPVIILRQHDSLSTKNFKIFCVLENMMKEPSGIVLRIQGTGEAGRHGDAALLVGHNPEPARVGCCRTEPHLIGTDADEPFQFARGREQTFNCTGNHGERSYGISVLPRCRYLVLSKFETDDLLSAIAKYRATCLPLVLTILVGLINHAETVKAKYDLRTLQSVMSGGAPLSKKVIEAFLETLGEV